MFSDVFFLSFFFVVCLLMAILLAVICFPMGKIFPHCQMFYVGIFFLVVGCLLLGFLS